jgi:hypothetical protein
MTGKFRSPPEAHIRRRFEGVVGVLPPGFGKKGVNGLSEGFWGLFEGVRGMLVS